MEKEISINYFRLQNPSLYKENKAHAPNTNITLNQNNIPENRGQKYTHGKGIHRGYDMSSEEKIINHIAKEVGSPYRVSRVNIDSRYRNIETKNILDDKISYLKSNPLQVFPKSNIIRISHENHGYQREDKIVLQGITGNFINLRDGMTLIKNSNFIKINHVNHKLFNNYNSSVDNIELNIIISGVIGNTVRNTSLNNIPINEINKKHRIYFKRNNADTPNAHFYYIKINTFSDDDLEYNLSDVNIYFLELAGIPINELNANYPVNINQLNGYHIISNIVDKDHYEIVTGSSSVLSSLMQVGGEKCWVARITDFIEGYPNNNYYKISLKKTYYNVRKIRLISTEFPNTERVIKDYPPQKKNNGLYWQISNDGDQIYSIDITPGNYTILTLKEELESKISLTERSLLTFLNNNVTNNDYYYKTNIVPVVDIKSQTDTFSLKLFETIIIKKPFTLVNTVSSDGFQRMRVYHPNHKLSINDTITISNSSSTESVPSEILNTSHIVEQILDNNNYLIKLPRYNPQDSDATNGGDAVNITYPIKFRLLFDRPGTMGSILGFQNVGATSSITVFDTEITNSSQYENVIEQTPNNNVINLSGDNYILMSCPLFKESYTSGSVDGVFAKLLLASDPGTVMYNQYVQLGEDFSVPISSLSEFEVTFYDPTGELFYFNNMEHSYTLEIYEDIRQE